jgi:hypothetical protein
MDSFKLSTAHIINERLKKAIEPILQEYGCSLRTKLPQDIDKDFICLELNLFRNIKNADGSIKAPEHMLWDKHCLKHGLKSEDWGKIITTDLPQAKGKSLKLWAIDTRKTKYCIETVNVDDECDVVCLSAMDTLNALNKCEKKATLFVPGNLQIPGLTQKTAEKNLEVINKAPLFTPANPTFPGIKRKIESDGICDIKRVKA